jgi:hypothetical protein
MRHCLIICALWMTGCDKRPPVVAQPYVPADLLVPCRPTLRPALTEGDFADNALARAEAYDCTVGKLEAVAQIIGPQ